ncbi:MAG: pyridoxal phosphate-dependent aminotransferase, partial [Deltaproteobacteria bacterium]|nr:pyridoxal phosphate-dependent aminotransferase [Deltaproteobacteria bacterium]
SNQLRAEGKTIFKLGLGQSPFPVPAPVVEALRSSAHEKDYLPVKGLGALRDVIAAYHSRVHDIELSGENVLIAPGSKELMFLLQLAYDGVLTLPAPSWVSYEPQARIIGQDVQWIITHRSDGWRLTPDSLRAFCESEEPGPRLLILNYPSNPSGASFTSDDLAALADVARQHRLLVLSDEIYGEVHHRGEHLSISTFYPEGTIISSGLSKWCGAGGWRLGYFTFPNNLAWLCDAMAAAASETYTSTSAPIQYAAIKAFANDGSLDQYLADSRRVLGALCRWVVGQLQAVQVPCGDPVGGFYVFPDFAAHGEALAARGIRSSPMLCQKLLEDTGVAILPGSCFGRPANELTVRIAYVDFDGAAALEAARDLGELDETFVRQYCANVVLAIEALCAWLGRQQESD